MTAFAPLDALSRDEIDARLAGVPEERLALIRTAAEAGLAEAQAVLGQMLLDGAEVKKDERAAFRWFLRAAGRQHLMALNMVGRCYDLGWGTRIDKARAAECFRIAAERGLDWAMYNYATLLTLGHGVAEDKAAALAWFEKAAALGNAKAINFVGSFHEDGWVVPRNLDKAADCYRRAAEGGDFRGQFNHARMLIARGHTDLALLWLGRCAARANERFKLLAAGWLERQAVPRVRKATRLFTASLSRSDGEGGVAARHAGGMPEGEARLRSSRWPKHGGGVTAVDLVGLGSSSDFVPVPLHHPSGGCAGDDCPRQSPAMSGGHGDLRIPPAFGAGTQER
jgi:TPR repeat protein